MTQTSSELLALVGKTVVIGLNYAQGDGTRLFKHQLHGVIVAADDEGVLVRDSEGKDVFLPPAAHAFVPAEPGTYRLRATGQEVEDPDLQTIWTIWNPGTADEWWEVVTGRDEPSETT